MKLSRKTSAVLLFTLFLASCQSRQTVSPPPYIGTPQEISTYEVKGLRFVTTVTFTGMFAEEQIREYAQKHHYRYYVMTLRSFGKDKVERMSAMIYR
ncbi:MAG: hypothetical protein ACTIOQ_14970 [Serratia grimesii]|uniref:hypothetical protein n=1 Tax=Serratia grimesii TaxID=82995 RepID=UPI003F951C15